MLQQCKEEDMASTFIGMKIKSEAKPEPKKVENKKAKPEPKK